MSRGVNDNDFIQSVQLLHKRLERLETLLPSTLVDSLVTRLAAKDPHQSQQEITTGVLNGWASPGKETEFMKWLDHLDSCLMPHMDKKAYDIQATDDPCCYIIKAIRHGTVAEICDYRKIDNHDYKSSSYSFKWLQPSRGVKFVKTLDEVRDLFWDGLGYTKPPRRW